MGGVKGERNIHYRHGAHKSRLYDSWQGMKRRVLYPHCKDYPRYGGRGITFYPPWADFQRFQSDVLREIGPMPDGLTLDRVDSNGNYEPGNIRWATMAEQNRNTCRTRFITFNGETLCITDWAARLGVRRNLIYQRLNFGWSVEHALTAPSRRAKSQPLTAKTRQ